MEKNCDSEDVTARIACDVCLANRDTSKPFFIGCKALEDAEEYVSIYLKQRLKMIKRT